MNDAGIFIDSDGIADLRVVGVDLVADDGLETAVLLSLFSDKAATAPELPSPGAYKRGWWGDLVADIVGDKFGSKLWTLARAKPSLQTLQRYEELTQDALNWLIEDGIAESVSVSAAYSGAEFSRGGVILQISITKSGKTTRYSLYWDGQKLRHAS